MRRTPACYCRGGRLSSLPHAGGEHVNVLLDALICVVDGVVDEPPAVIGLAAQPVTGEPVVNHTRQAMMNRCVR